MCCFSALAARVKPENVNNYMLISAQALWDKEQAQGHRHTERRTYEGHTHRETGRQIEIEEQTERQTDRQTYVKRNRQIVLYSSFNSRIWYAY